LVSPLTPLLVRLEREMETGESEILAGTDAHRVESVHAFTLENVRLF
jgi:hypothetical protein